MRNKIIGWGVALVLIVVVVGSVMLKANSTKEQHAYLRIGAAIALTGYGASFGESELKAIQLLKKKYPTIEFFIEDNKSDPKGGLLAVRKLIDVHNVDVVYCDLTTVANAIVPLLREQKIVLIAAVYLENLLKRSPYAIRNLPRGIDEARLLLEHLKIKEPTARNLAAVGSNDEFGNSSLADFKKAASEANMPVVFTDAISDEERQLASLAQKIVSNRPDAIYLASLMPSLGILIREIRIAGFKGVILTTDAFAYPYIKSAAGAYAKDTVYVNFPMTDTAKHFANKFREQFSQDLAPSAVLCYDGISIIVDACLASPGRTPASVVSENLNDWKYAGVYGEVLIRDREIIYPLVIEIAK